MKLRIFCVILPVVISLGLTAQTVLNLDTTKRDSLAVDSARVLCNRPMTQQTEAVYTLDSIDVEQKVMQIRLQTIKRKLEDYKRNNPPK